MNTPTSSQNAEIVVEGYSERYAEAFRKLLGIEGGFVDDPADRGGATKYGISLRFLKAAGDIDEDLDGYADFDLDFDGDIDGRDIRKLSLGDARYLYLKFFWEELECESFPEPIGEMLFDQGVNGGNHAARKLLQQAINLCLGRAGVSPIGVDGGVGKETRRGLQKVLGHSLLGISAIVDAYRQVVKERYKEIVRRNPSQARFLNGWLNRAEALGR